MIKQMDLQTSIADYKKDKKNSGKIAIYEIATNTIIFEGEEKDWVEMETKVESLNTDSEKYYLVIVPHSKKQVRAFSWG